MSTAPRTSDRRRFNDLELARVAKEAGVGAVLIKSHQNSTVERAWLVSQCVPGIRVYGGLVLNETVGGLNLSAVRLALTLGAREIWMPTRSARNDRLYHNQEGGISILDESGESVAGGQRYPPCCEPERLHPRHWPSESRRRLPFWLTQREAGSAEDSCDPPRVGTNVSFE